MGRSCGDCTACCTIYRVPELQKKAWVRCEHQEQNGCGIYDRRPKMCRAFECYYLQDPKNFFDPKTRKKVRFSREYRPDRLGIVFSSQWLFKHRTIAAHELFPGASKRPRAHRLISILSEFCIVTLQNDQGLLRIVGPDDVMEGFREKLKEKHPGAVLTPQFNW